jgi:hypothetical protein
MAHKILGGWSLDGVYTYTSGSNFSIDAATGYAGAGTTAAGTSEFTPLAGTINPQRVRDRIYGHGGWFINSALFKEFRVTERHRFMLRWEQYDTLNHPNWSGLNTTPTSAAFGKITTKSGNRDQQLALKYFG